MAEDADNIHQVKVFRFGWQWECYRVVAVLVDLLVIFHREAVVSAVLEVEALAAAVRVEAGKISLVFKVQRLRS